MAKAPDKSAQAVTDALLVALRPHADLVHTLTYDNGKEFAYHQTISKELNAQGYFAHPYHSWERGLNENTNGLIRTCPRAPISGPLRSNRSAAL
ncbi:MAG TPA: IS30 family transposase [Deltaproteobacteria bacterium]|nr:IS30 family transposase [Deltaproteobacteria bacterium]